MSEADYMHSCQLAQSGGEMEQDDPEFEVIRGKRQDRVFVGSRAACWDYRRQFGGFVREYTGEYDEWEFSI